MSTPPPPPLEPAMWYAVQAQDNTETCENFGKVFDVNPFYSNDGIQVLIECGLCRQPMEMISATLLDPQPVFS
ncbi:hypothetical protein [Streptomyces sp. NPDC004230]